MGGDRVARKWQQGIWDQLSDVYQRETDACFVPVVDHVIRRADLQPGQQVLDIGTGTGSVALEAARRVGPSGGVTATDISGDMLAVARRRAQAAGVTNLSFTEGRAEQIDAPDGSFDVIVSSLCFMYVLDREAAARECARVLKPGGRFVAAVWAGPETADIVRFQSTVGSFAPPPPVPGVGPGALADPTLFVEQLRAAGIDARVETETCRFEIATFDLAWEMLAAVTIAGAPPDRIAEAKAAVQALMWPDVSKPRTFSNETQFIVGARG